VYGQSRCASIPRFFNAVPMAYNLAPKRPA